MTSIQISIKKELYDKLKMLKKPEESFSDIIEKLMNGTSNVQEVIACYGISRSENEQEMLDAYAEARKTIRMGISSRLKEKE